MCGTFSLCRVNLGDALCSHLDNNEVGYLIHYPIPPHRQKCYSEYKEVDLPLTDSIHDSVLSVPISPVLDVDDVTVVIDVLNKFK